MKNATARNTAALVSGDGMLKNLMMLGSLACVLCVGATGYSQALPTATGRGALQVGGGWSLAMPDYGQAKIQGATAFADFDFSTHIGVEADLHYLAFVTPDDLAEDTYLIGPRFIFRRGRYNIYAKALAGIGDLVIQNPNDNVGRQAGKSFAYAGGVGVDINVRRHLVVRAIDLEYQHWNYLTGLTPIVATVGIAYRFR